jgi:transposase-like protein
MSLINVSRTYATRQACLDKLEQMRWPDGKFGCIKCGVYEQDGKPAVSKFVTAASTCERVNKKTGKVRVCSVPARTLYQCKACGKQFSVTEGTVFHRSHISIEKWFLATALILEAKKGISSLQVGRNLGVKENNTKSTWFLCHRIREAAIEAGFEFLTGTVEVDETYLTPRKPRKGKPYVKQSEPMVVLGMRQRGGPLRLVPVKAAKMAHIEPEIVKHISPDATLQTDSHPIYHIIGKRRFVNHRMIDHIRSYADGDNHTNTVESAFSLLKKGVYGTFHKVSIKHLGRYCNEFAYRFDRRGMQERMFDETLKRLVNGKPLPFKKLTASDETNSLNPSGPAL